MLHRPSTLIQISDSHLFANDERSLLGIKTRQSFADVIKMIRAQESEIDHIVVTGDISQDDSMESYHYCHKVLSDMHVPFSWLKGNHDDMSTAASVMYQANFPDIQEVGNWLILMVDTHVSGEIHGMISEEAMARLEEQLVTHQDRPLLVAMHHHPIPVHSRWMDDICLSNREAVMTLLKGYPQVQAVIHGHTHQERDQVYNGIRVLGIPSTCVQFAPGSEDFAVDNQQPGYRRLRLFPDGRIETSVHRLPDNTWLPDRSQAGY
ncbi:3',5'-cyclic-AMP phosphodiesterase [Parendozoicomonas haliclonae]|uniref:3',5'-cyclic adenosine monophosphate phosphodiesterase CpdA n=1 Tax=Parendozoicomonas haliclonae TaxID=1960125 RepID=A0A1X7AG55_9GAMM|nr:3',5'-cyclic-AMP phosphodiesterase [Parendozoicomonas haliclonae]SMA37776.1 3',5'-cyclic adenosine monophosphate phosphodiesterase CpdA [Parendozoicomonas haliclonae]